MHHPGARMCGLVALRFGAEAKLTSNVVVRTLHRLATDGNNGNLANYPSNVSSGWP